MLQRLIFCVLLSGMMAITSRADQYYNYDVVIYGGTSGGIVAAIQADNMGKTVALIETTQRIGGMTTNGLSATDVGSSSAIQGLARQFYLAVGQAYNEASGSMEFNFEPHVALNIYQQWLQNSNVALFTNERLDLVNGVTKQGTVIQSIRTESGKVFFGKEFIDASYEGDVMAKAGVTYTIGREANSQYGEDTNGIVTTNTLHNPNQFFTNAVSPYITPGNPASGLLPGINATGPGVSGSADSRVQAYNYRVIVTQAASRLPWNTPPPGYSASQYELLRRYIVANNITTVAGDSGIAKFSSIKGSKFDMNNNCAVSTDFIGQNYAYPDGDYATRATIVQNHYNWQMGLYYYLANDPGVPAAVRNSMNSYGLTADEFTDNNGWSDQLYVREARRMIGAYVMTEANATGATTVSDPICLASYTMDSHHTQRYVTASGAVQNEGGMQVTVSNPYGLSYRAITPQASQVTNLLVCGALSASHQAYGSIRLEPTYMAMGQSAATAACIAIDDQTSVQSVSYSKLQAQLLADGQGLGSLPGPSSIVCDDSDSSTFSTTGAWLSSTATSGFYGSDYLQDGNTGQGTKTATFTPNLPTAGTYLVEMNWPQHVNRATNIPVQITHSGSPTTTNLTINEQNPGTWVSLGTYSFQAGTSGNVRISNANTNGFVVADAVRFTPSALLTLWATDGTAAEPIGTTVPAQSATITVARSGSKTNSLTVNLTISGTAQNGVDYVTVPSTITIPANAATASLTITPLADNIAEGSETVVVSLASNNSVASGTPNSATVIIKDQPIDAWRFAHFTAPQLTDGSVSGDIATPAGDNVTNLAKYAFNLNPATPANAAIGTPSTVTVGGNQYLALTYSRIKTNDLTFQSEISSDLFSWSSSPSSVVETILADDNHIQTVQARSLTPLTSGQKGFIRVRASRVP